jgi:O-antigen/teichoic acid export membrane protein
MYSPLIGFALSVEMAAVFRGMQNFFLPFTQVVTALSLLITPYLSRIRFTSTNKKFKNSIYCLLLISLLISVIYSVLIVIFGNTICKVVYNNVIYLQNTWIIPYIAFSTILITLNSALGVLFRVIEKPNIVLYEKIIAAIAVFLISIPLVILLKMKGALIGLNISLLIELITLLVFGYFQLRQRKLHEEIFPKNSKAFFSD